MASPTQWSLSKLWETVKDRETWRAVAQGITELDTTSQMNNKGTLRKKATHHWKGQDDTVLYKSSAVSLK